MAENCIIVITPTPGNYIEASSVSTDPTYSCEDTCSNNCRSVSNFFINSGGFGGDGTLALELKGDSSTGAIRDSSGNDIKINNTNNKIQNINFTGPNSESTVISAPFSDSIKEPRIILNQNSLGIGDDYTIEFWQYSRNRKANGGSTLSSQPLNTMVHLFDNSLGLSRLKLNSAYAIPTSLNGQSAGSWNGLSNQLGSGWSLDVGGYESNGSFNESWGSANWSLIGQNQSSDEFPLLLYQGKSDRPVIAMSDEQWTHTILQRNGCVFRLWVNGIESYPCAYELNSSENTIFLDSSTFSNVALGKTYTYSKDPGNDSGYGDLTNGRLNETTYEVRWRYLTEPVDITMDLEQSYLINSVSIWHTIRGTYYKRPVEISISTSEDNITYSDPIIFDSDYIGDGTECGTYAETGSYGCLQDYEIGFTNCRYVKITLVSPYQYDPSVYTQYMAINEVLVNGTIPQSGNTTTPNINSNLYPNSTYGCAGLIHRSSSCSEPSTHDVHCPHVEPWNNDATLELFSSSLFNGASNSSLIPFFGYVQDFKIWRGAKYLSSMQSQFSRTLPDYDFNGGGQRPNNIGSY